jgi:hypothetical protein
MELEIQLGFPKCTILGSVVGVFPCEKVLKKHHIVE